VCTKRYGTGIANNGTTSAFAAAKDSINNRLDNLVLGCGLKFQRIRTGTVDDCGSVSDDDADRGHSHLHNSEVPPDDVDVDIDMWSLFPTCTILIERTAMRMFSYWYYEDNMKYVEDWPTWSMSCSV